MVVERLASVGGWWAKQQKVPRFDGGLRVEGGEVLRAGGVIPPTDAGWQRFLATPSELPRADLVACAAWWWGRQLPRGDA